MQLSKKQKDLLDFIPISQMRKKVLQLYAILLVLIPISVDNYYDVSHKFWNIVLLVDAVLIIISILILIRPNTFFALFHLFMGFTSIYASLIFFIGYSIEAKPLLGIINIAFSTVIYFVAVFIINFSIVRMNFSKYPKSSNKISPILMLAPIIGMIVYNLVENSFKINGMVIASYLLAIAMGIPIHSLYRGYLILKYKYKPSDT